MATVQLYTFEWRIGESSGAWERSKQELDFDSMGSEARKWADVCFANGMTVEIRYVDLKKSKNVSTYDD